MTFPKHISDEIMIQTYFRACSLGFTEKQIGILLIDSPNHPHTRLFQDQCFAIHELFFELMLYFGNQMDISKWLNAENSKFNGLSPFNFALQNPLKLKLIVKELIRLQK